MKQNGFLIIASVIMLNALYATAADLYRCGSTFQDTPCNNTSPSQPYKKSVTPVNKDVAATTIPSTATIDSDCKKQGDTAKKIMWMREIGKTAEDQIAAPPDGASPNLIRDVYNHRGSSLEVKNSIEQECMQQKEKDKLAARLMAEAEKLKFGDKNPSSVQTNRKVSTLGSTQINDTSAQTTQTIDYKFERCNYIKVNLEKIANNRRTGGNAQYMESLKRDQSRLNDEFKSRGC